MSRVLTLLIILTKLNHSSNEILPRKNTRFRFGDTKRWWSHLFPQ